MTATLTEAVYRTETGGYRVTGSRVSLDSVVIEHKKGESAEAIVENFPTLSLDQVHAALAYYERNRQEVDRYLEEQGRLWEELRARSEKENAVLLARLRAYRDRKAQ